MPQGGAIAGTVTSGGGLAACSRGLTTRSSGCDHLPSSHRKALRAGGRRNELVEGQTPQRRAEAPGARRRPGTRSLEGGERRRSSSDDPAGTNPPADLWRPSCRADSNASSGRLASMPSSRCRRRLSPGLGLGVEISCRVYRPRKARESPLFQLVERHLEELLRVWPTHFARQRGPLRPVVERVLRGFMRCGLVEHGYVVTQSVLSLHHAHAAAGDDHAATPPSPRALGRAAAHGVSPARRACARRVLDEAAESVDGS
jgi:hypothetical protein